MIRNPKDLQRYSAPERANHWVLGICFVLLALSGLAFFHSALLPTDAVVWRCSSSTAAITATR